MSRPPLFADLPFAAALAEAQAAGKLLLVDATAAWCGPCQLMDRTTWIDPSVVAAISAQALAIQLDVDAEKETAQRLEIRAMPTMIVFRAGAEVDRVVGAKKPAEMLAWLGALASGERWIDRRRGEVGEDPDQRVRFARELTRANERFEALQIYLDLWDRWADLDREHGKWKRYFMTLELARLCKAFAPARDAFAARRDQLDPAHDLEDWLALNEILDDLAASLRWFDALDKATLTHDVRERYIGLLRDADRWADVAPLLGDPLARLGHRLDRRREDLDEMRAVMSPDHLARLEAASISNSRKEASMIVRSLRAAGRTDEADAVAAEARRRDPSPEMAKAVE
ncbi:MAG: thioredoxin family protein [Deltaproteobacteria bacterium]|nr:thioredoxin family protein [Deltaproteobacteria bacterium]